MNRRHRHVSLLGVLLLAVLAACSGDDGAVETGAPATTATTSLVTTTADQEETDSTTPDTAASSDADRSGTSTSSSTSSTSTTSSPTTTTSTTTTPSTTATSSTTSSTTTTTAPPEGDGDHIIVGSDIYKLTPSECLVFDGADVLVTGPGTGPDGSPVYVAISIEVDATGGIMIDLGSADPIERSDELLVSGAGATEDDFEATVTGNVLQVTGSFIAPSGGDPIPGSAEVNCGR